MLLPSSHYFWFLGVFDIWPLNQIWSLKCLASSLHEAAAGWPDLILQARQISRSLWTRFLWSSRHMDAWLSVNICTFASPRIVRKFYFRQLWHKYSTLILTLPNCKCTRTCIFSVSFLHQFYPIGGLEVWQSLWNSRNCFFVLMFMVVRLV